MNGARPHAIKTTIASLAIGLAMASPAWAFYCYVPEKPEGFVPLRDRPSVNAKIIQRMENGSMVRSVPSVKERDGWVYVNWYKSQLSKRPDGRGWTMRREIHGGECED